MIIHESSFKKKSVTFYQLPNQLVNWLKLFHDPPYPCLVTLLQFLAFIFIPVARHRFLSPFFASVLLFSIRWSFKRPRWINSSRGIRDSGTEWPRRVHFRDRDVSESWKGNGGASNEVWLRLVSHLSPRRSRLRSTIAKIPPLRVADAVASVESLSIAQTLFD